MPIITLVSLNPFAPSAWPLRLGLTLLIGGTLLWFFRRYLLDFRNRLHRLITANTRLKAEIVRRENAERLQQVLFGIAAAVYATHETEELYPAIQAQLAKIIDTENFFITLVDPLTQALQVGFMRDQHQIMDAYPDSDKTLSRRVIATGKPLLITAPEVEALIESGELERHGAPAQVWLGVPLRIKDRVLGLVGVQHYEDPHRYTRKEMALLQFVSEQVALAIQRKLDQEALLRSEQEKSLVLSHLSEQVVHYDKDYRILWINRAAENEMGQGKPLVGQTCYQVWHGRETPCDDCPVAETLRTGQPVTRETTSVSGHNGLENTYPVHDDDGQTVGVVEIMMDITETKRAEERLKQSLQEKEVLLKEIHHRVKNNMQIISSLLNLQANHQPHMPLSVAYKESQARIRSMALVHEQLYRSNDLRQIQFDAYIRQLIDHIRQIFTLDQAPSPTLTLDAGGVTLPIGLAIPCGLIINELVSNALKYAFPSPQQSPPEIRIQMRATAEGRVTLKVSDNGVGLPPAARTGDPQTLGLRLVQILVSDQLSGEVTLPDSGQGAAFEIDFPLHS